MEKVLLIYLLLINIVSFGAFYLDKRRAQKQQTRISERELLALAVLGGALGALLAQQILRHKTKKLLFKIALPVLVIFQFLILVKIWPLLLAR